ncbi:VWA domain-containing protein [Hyphomonas sp.]|uniref:VWA domain-containing protein n=1 Tax=Hyphomonas sp. TaxID=87 RepID=UPI00391A4C80
MKPEPPPRLPGGGRREAYAALRQEAARRADRILALLALMPHRLGGVIVEGASPEAAAMLSARLGSWMEGSPQPIRMPASISDDRLSGGLDLAATLAAGRPVAQPGLLAAADGGLIIVPMAERLTRRIAAQIARTMDTGLAVAEREGLSFASPARFALILLSDAAEEGEGVPDLLAARTAFRLPAHFLQPEAPTAHTGGTIAAARARLAAMSAPDDLIGSVIAAAATLGIASARPPAFLLAAAQGLAALDGAASVEEDHILDAAALVFPPLAAPPEAAPPQPPAPPKETDSRDTPPADPGQMADDLAELLVSAVRTRALLDTAQRQAAGGPRRKGEAAAGKSGEMIESKLRGSRISARPGDPRRDGRLDLIATLRAAAPWQRLRPPPPGGNRIAVRATDFRLQRFRHRSEAVVIFTVDASGSSAMNRLAEAKGAIEYLLSGCYSRRESVALIAFRREGADLLLPPTRSLTRVKRSLAHLPGGGGTPLAAGIAAAHRLADQAVRRRQTPHVVILSDGQANIALSGEGGREAAAADAARVAARLKAAKLPVLFFDISRRPSPQAQKLSAEMGASYEPLPFADGRRVSETVRSVLLG